MNLDAESLRITQRLRRAEGDQAFSLDVFGNDLAEREKYKSISGIEAVHLYLIRKYGWLPRDVRSMTTEDLRLALHVELQDWTWPAGTREALDQS